MATYIWNGPGTVSPGSGVWANALEWSIEGTAGMASTVPGGGDSAVLPPGGYTVTILTSYGASVGESSVTEIGDLTFLGPTTTLDVAAGASLFVARNLIEAGQMNLATGSEVGGVPVLGRAVANPALEVGGSLNADGVISVVGGAVSVGTVAKGSGEIDLESGASLGVVDSLESTLTVRFADTTASSLSLHPSAGESSGYGGMISGFGGANELLLFGATVLGLDYQPEASGMSSLSVTFDMNGGSSQTATFTFDGQYGGATPFAETVFGGSDDPGGAAISLSNSASGTACFAVGTRIATPGGEVDVRALRPGDQILALRVIDGRPGSNRPVPVTVRWIGRRRVRCDDRNAAVSSSPLRVRAGAFGPGRPARDLLLSPDHAVFLADAADCRGRGSLIPVRHLADGDLVAPAVMTRVDYVHIELERHDVILAEQLPCETWLDTGNRHIFENAGLDIPLYPRQHAGAAARAWLEEACAPLVTDGPILQRALADLRSRGQAIGANASGPLLRLLTDGCEIWPALRGGVEYRFVLPLFAREVRLVSRITSPESRNPGDVRVLGVPVVAINCDGTNVALDDSRLRFGWHEIERDGSGVWRWTNGNASIRGPVRRLDVLLAGPI